jgi:hypothetical protein
MKKTISVILLLLISTSVILSGCRFGSYPEESASSFIPKDISFKDYPNNIYGILKALTDRGILKEGESEVKDMLGYFLEETGGEVDETISKKNKEIRENQSVGKISDNIRVMSAALIEAKHGVRVSFQNNNLNQKISFELYEYADGVLTQSKAGKEIAEKGTFNSLGHDVEAEILGDKYVLVYSDKTVDAEGTSLHKDQKSYITDTISQISAGNED